MVIPVYNAAHLVGDAVASALAQTWPTLEVVVVDDGSRDDPAGALAEAVRGGRVRVVRQENRGAAGARNSGVSEAVGDLIAFCDDDDEWLPGKLTTQVALLGQHEAPVAAVSGGLIIDYAGRRHRRMPEKGVLVFDDFTQCNNELQALMAEAVQGSS